MTPEEARNRINDSLNTIYAQAEFLSGLRHGDVSSTLFNCTSTIREMLLYAMLPPVQEEQMDKPEKLWRVVYQTDVNFPATTYVLPNYCGSPSTENAIELPLSDARILRNCKRRELAAAGSIAAVWLEEVKD